MAFRSLLLLLLSVVLQCAPLGAGAFDLADVDREALSRAAQPWKTPPAAAASHANYDNWRDLRFRRDRALWHAAQLPFEAQFFPAEGPPLARSMYSRS